MNRRASPAYLTIAAVVVTLGIAATEVAVASVGTALPSWVVWAFQLIPATVRTILMWMIGCFIAMRHGATDWTTRTVPIGLGVLIVAGHAIASYATSPSRFYSDATLLAAVGESTSLVLMPLSILVLSQILNVSLRHVDCVIEIAPLRFTVSTILIATTCIAVFLALQTWVNDLKSNLITNTSSVRPHYLVAYVLSYFCYASAVFGAIWALKSTRRRWLGIFGLTFWIASPITHACLLLSPEIQKQLPPGIVTKLLTMLITSNVAGLAGKLMSIPIFRLFGYQFRIGDQGYD